MGTPFQTAKLALFAVIGAVPVASRATPLTIDDFNPKSGGIGTFVQVTGSGFAASSSEVPSFGRSVIPSFGGVEAHWFPKLAPNDCNRGLLTQVPEGATTGPIRVTSCLGTAISAEPFFVFSVTGFSPMSGPVSTEVRIAGGDFTGVTEVRFSNALGAEAPGGVVAFWEMVDQENLIATVPEGATTGPIIVLKGDGPSTSAASFTVEASEAPVITSFSPLHGVAISGRTVRPTVVTILGEHFTGATRVTFDDREAWKASILSDTVIVAQPFYDGSTSSGPIGVENDLDIATSSAIFEVVSPPIVSAISPGEGGAGTAVTIEGANFTFTEQVTFGASTVAADFMVQDDETLIAIVPLGSTSSWVTVTNPAGAVSSSDGFFFVLPGEVAPTIAGFSPSSGRGRVEVTILGSHFTGATAVKFNETEISLDLKNFVLNSDGEITIFVPEEATTGPVSVTTDPGLAAAVFGSYVALPLPTITGIDPLAALPGTLITIAGTSFSAPAAVDFIGQGKNFIWLTLSASVVDETHVTVVVPEDAAISPYGIWLSFGEVSLRYPENISQPFFNVIGPAPTITSFTPDHGEAGDLVTISGVDFLDAESKYPDTRGQSLTSVQFFDGVDAPPAKVGNCSTRIEVTVPEGAVTGPITVATPSGTAISSSIFWIGEAPGPDAGSVPGTQGNEREQGSSCGCASAAAAPSLLLLALFAPAAIATRRLRRARLS
jgi:hypothetical protein